MRNATALSPESENAFPRLHSEVKVIERVDVKVARVHPLVWCVALSLLAASAVQIVMLYHLGEQARLLRVSVDAMRMEVNGGGSQPTRPGHGDGDDLLDGGR